MGNYLLRRVLYGLLVLLGVNLITFVLFFQVNSPDDMARLALGGKRVAQESVDQWKREKGYDLPLLINSEAPGTGTLTETIFFQKSVPMFVGEFGSSDDGRNIANEIVKRAGPSLALAVPVFVLSVHVAVSAKLIPGSFSSHKDCHDTHPPFA